MAEDNQVPEDLNAILEVPSADNPADNGADKGALNTDDTQKNDDGDDGDDNGQDNEINNAQDDDEREAIRERRRQERHQKKEWRKENDDRNRREREMLRKENEALATRLAALEQRAVGNEFAQLDTAVEQTSRAIAQIKEQIRYATEAADGAVVAEATEKLYQARQYLDHLNNLKKNAVNQTRQIEQRSPIDPRVRRQAEIWAEKNTWYDPGGTDADSKVAKMIDQSLTDDGWNPQEGEYWQELDTRLRRYLPHRYVAQRTNSEPRSRTPVSLSGHETRSSSTTSGWKLSADRVAAIKEAGAWDDVEKRDKMIKNYRAYDKANNR